MIDQFHAIIHENLGYQVSGCIQVTGGNSRVYKIHCADGTHLIAKVYPSMEQDPRNRLKTEFSAFSFLRKNGIQQIPEPLYAAHDCRIGVYSFIVGDRVPHGQITVEDINCVVAFIKDLYILRKQPESIDQPSASEACFSFQCYLDHINRRLKPFHHLENSTDQHRAVKVFLSEELDPLYEDIKDDYIKQISSLGLGLTDELPVKCRTLSPSDFGFHNALRQPDGRIIFLDFEYFGWDDPAKLIIDFIQHPAQCIPYPARNIFINETMQVFQHDPQLATRVRLLYPILGLKWCLIMLNEFLPGYLERRQSADATLNIEEVLRIQLEKARRHLSHIRPCVASDVPFTLS